MIKNIIFDLAEVYLIGLFKFEEVLSPLLGIEPAELDKMFKGQNFWNYMNGRISENTYLRTIIEKNKLHISLDDLKNIIRKRFVEIPGTRKIIESLSNYNLGLLSVHGLEWIDYCNKKYDYHKLFNTVMYSYQVGVSKPDPQSFKLILEKMNAIPEETLFIDDSKMNIEAANKLGLTAIQFRNAEQLVQDLNNLGIMLR